MNTDFEEFKKHFTDYQKRFGLTGYKVYFKNEPSDEHFASIKVDQINMTATVNLNSKLPKKDEKLKDIKGSAKHEALHLLTHRLEDLARYRYITSDQVYEACEELVIKLESLIE